MSKRGVCPAPNCGKRIAFRVATILLPDGSEPEPQSVQAAPEPEPDPEREAKGVGQDWYTPRPNPLNFGYETPSFFEGVDVCAEHVDYYKTAWESDTSVVIVTPIAPPRPYPKGHWVQPKVDWGGSLRTSYWPDMGLVIGCETLAPESYQKRSVQLLLTEDMILKMLAALRRAAITARSKPMTEES